VSETVSEAVDSATAVSEPSSDPEVAKPPRKRGGRPSKLTDKLLEEACKHVSVGVPAELAFENLGINRVTFWRWKKAAEEGDELYARAFDKLRQAKAGILIRLSNKWIKLLNDSKSPDAIYKAMHTLEPELFKLHEQGPGISVTQNVKSEHQTLVVGAGYDAESRGTQQLTKKGADAMKEGFLLGGKTRDEVYGQLAEHGVIVGSVDAGGAQKATSDKPQEQPIDTDGEST
jgi:hypothetical protein